MAYDTPATKAQGDLISVDDWEKIGTNFAALLVNTVNVVFDGGGVAITTGVTIDVLVDYKCNITAAYLLCDSDPTSDQRIAIDIWMENPTSDHIPTSDDAICTSDNGLICSTATGAFGSNALTSWTVAVPALSVLRFHIDDCDGVVKATAALQLTRSS